jgi:hypothetical protein
MFAEGKEAGRAEAARRVREHFEGLAKRMPARSRARTIARSIWRNSPALQEQTGPYGDSGYIDWESGFIRGFQAYLDNEEWKQ